MKTSRTLSTTEDMTGSGETIYFSLHENGLFEIYHESGDLSPLGSYSFWTWAPAIATYERLQESFKYKRIRNTALFNEIVMRGDLAR